MPNKNILMTLFSAMKLSCVVSGISIAKGCVVFLNMFFFSNSFDVCKKYIAKQSLAFH